MRSVGSGLITIGVLLGTVLGVALLSGVSVPGLPWLIAVGLAKMVFFSSLGLIGAGAALHRLARRQEERARLRSGEEQR
jgi:hypothetical protein